MILCGNLRAFRLYWLPVYPEFSKPYPLATLECCYVVTYHP